MKIKLFLLALCGLSTLSASDPHASGAHLILGTLLEKRIAAEKVWKDDLYIRNTLTGPGYFSLRAIDSIALRLLRRSKDNEPLNIPSDLERDFPDLNHLYKDILDGERRIHKEAQAVFKKRIRITKDNYADVSIVPRNQG